MSGSSDASRQVLAIYECALRGDPAAIRDLLTRRPQLIPEFLAHYGTVGSRLDRRLYEIVYLRVSTLNGCEACVRAHRESSRWVGLGAAHWQALESGDRTLFDPREQSAILFAEKLTGQPDSVDASDVAVMRNDFSAEQVVDLQLLVELANLSSRLPDPLKPELKGPKLRIGADPSR